MLIVIPKLYGIDLSFLNNVPTVGITFPAVKNLWTNGKLQPLSSSIQRETKASLF